MTSLALAGPRERNERKNSAQNTPSSLSPTARPSTSRPPSARTPVAITTAREMTRPRTRAFTYVASADT